MAARRALQGGQRLVGSFGISTESVQAFRSMSSIVSSHCKPGSFPLSPSTPGVGVRNPQYQHQNPFLSHCQLRHAHNPPKKLSVVLRSIMPGLGRPGDVVRVSPGYARNYLIPSKLAFPALEKFVRAVRAAKEQGHFGSEDDEAVAPESEKVKESEDASAAAKVEVSPQERIKEAEEIAERLDSLTLSIRRNVPRRSTEVRQPVTADDIIKEVARQVKISLEPQNLDLLTPLKTVGAFEVPLRFPQDVTLPGGKEQIALKIKIRRV